MLLPLLAFLPCNLPCDGFIKVDHIEAPTANTTLCLGLCGFRGLYRIWVLIGTL